MGIFIKQRRKMLGIKDRNKNVRPVMPICHYIQGVRELRPVSRVTFSKTEKHVFTCVLNTLAGHVFPLYKKIQRLLYKFRLNTGKNKQ